MSKLRRLQVAFIIHARERHEQAVILVKGRQCLYFSFIMSDLWRFLTVSATDSIGAYRGVRHDDHGDEVYRDFDLWLGQTGHGTVYVGGRPIDFGAGMVVLATPGVPIRLKLDDRNPIAMSWAHFDCFVRGKRIADARPYVDIDRLTLSLPHTPPIALVAKVDATRIAQQFLAARARLHDDVTQLSLNMAIMDVVMRLRLTHVRPHDVESPDPSPLEHAVAYMQRHIAQPVKLDAVADHAGVSTATLRRMFAKQLRMSPGRYLTQIRMARARDLLRSADFNVSEVADACGFGSLSFFSRAFKAEHGRSPSAFRRQMHALP
jgi:AraC-like DNA-binding protein